MEFDPVSFLRNRRPDLFSDTEKLSRPILTQELLEYQLETLTKRKQETVFEYFCRRLAEKEICPNLRPQTGPTGGGDSKADSETIPVSEKFAKLWIGIDPAAATERWAFAFSAKKDWQPKAKKDIEGIAKTERSYKRIDFITNQFAPDRARSKLEDELSKVFQIRVIILDRSWIVKCVFEHDRIALAIETLGMHGLAATTEVHNGPRDLQLMRELSSLDAELADQLGMRTPNTNL